MCSDISVNPLATASRARYVVGCTMYMNIEFSRCRDMSSAQPASSAKRRDINFTRRLSAFPEKTEGCPSSLRLFTFYKELKSICTLKPAVELKFKCFNNREATEIDMESSALDIGQHLQEGPFEEVQFQLYMKEIRRINPALTEGCLFVDGLYELVCSRLPQSGDSPLKKSVTDLLTLHTSGSLLLEKYWKRPDDESQHSAYLAVASSFVQYILTTYGPKGVSQFLQNLDCSIVDPQRENFSFKGKGITSLEFKWTKFAEAHINEEFRLTTINMFRLLFKRYLMGHWASLIFIMIVMVVDVGATLALANATAQMINLGQLTFTSHHNLTEDVIHTPELELEYFYHLVQWAGIGIGLILLRFVIVMVTTALQAHLAVKVCKGIRRQLSDRLNHVNPNFLRDYSSSAIISTFLQDVTVIEKLVAHSLRTVLQGVLILLTFVLYTGVLIWQLALPLTVVYIIAQVGIWSFTSKLSEHSFAKSQATGKLCDIVKEQIDGYQVNRLYGLAFFWRKQFNNILHAQFSGKARRSLFLEKFTQLFQLMVPSIISSILTFAFILLLKYGYISFEKGLSIILFFSYVVIHVVAAASDFPTLQASTVALQRINAMLFNAKHTLSIDSYYQSLSKPPGSSRMPTCTANSLSIELKDLCFSYNATASHWNLFGVNLKIEAGERIAVLGKSGSGKSSLLNIILQVYEPTNGEINFGDNEEYSGLKVAATFQFNHIFNMTIRENIRIGNLQATDEEVEEAAKMADLHTWVSGLSRGYGTAVSSGGSSLSGGQKQRIAIARMLVAKAPILVLDEVTSALDPATENKVFTKLMEVTKGKTVIAATHRLEQAKEFDRIIVLSHGVIKEQGPHNDLMEKRGAYWMMWGNEAAVNAEKSPVKAVPIIRRRGSITCEQPLIRQVASAPALHSLQPVRAIGPRIEVVEASINWSKSQPNLTVKSLDNVDCQSIPRITSTPIMRKKEIREINDSQSNGSPNGQVAIAIEAENEASLHSSEMCSEMWWSCDSNLEHYYV